MDALNLKPVLEDRLAKKQASVDYKVTIEEMTNSAKKNSTDPHGVPGFPEGKMVRYEHYNYRPRAFTYYRDQDVRNEAKTFIDRYKQQHNLDPGPIYNTEVDLCGKKSVTMNNSPRFSI